MQINNMSRVSFGTKIDISSKDMCEMQKVANPYFSRIAEALKELKDDGYNYDVLEIKNVKVGDTSDKTSFVADVALYNKHMPEYRATGDQVLIHGMEGLNSNHKLFQLHHELKSKLENMLALTANMLNKD